jgi:hypothetical protein
MVYTNIYLKKKFLVKVLINTFNRQYKTLQHRTIIILNNIYKKVHHTRTCILHNRNVLCIKPEGDISKLKCDLKGKLC